MVGSGNRRRLQACGLEKEWPLNPSNMDPGGNGLAKGQPLFIYVIDFYTAFLSSRSCPPSGSISLASRERESHSFICLSLKSTGFQRACFLLKIILWVLEVGEVARGLPMFVKGAQAPDTEALEVWFRHVCAHGLVFPQIGDLMTYRLEVGLLWNCSLKSGVTQPCCWGGTVALGIPHGFFFDGTHP